MKLLFTGASGFLGNNVKPILEKQYQIETLGLSSNDHYNVNIANNIPVFENKFDIILHAAGKAHTIPKTEAEKNNFYDINYKGTVNLCKSLENCGLPKSFIFISSVAVYGLDIGENIQEDSPLLGKTPYARSKILAENFLIKWCNENNVILSIIRPSLLAGPNPPGNLRDMINGIKTNRYLSISNGSAKKSILMVQDIANLIPLLIKSGGIYNVCDDSNPSFRDLEELICKQLKIRLPFSIPYWFAKSIALLGDCLGNKFPINSLRLVKITKSLTFSNDKAKKLLNWNPLNVIDNFKID